MKAKQELLDRKITYAVAISGGVDSFAAAHFLKILKFKIHCIHFNHNLRAQNDVMQNVCARFCSDFRIPFTTDIRTCNKGELEHELRECRLNFFRSIGKPIICAHHLSDCAESYLMNAIKGCAEHLPIKPISYFGGDRPMTILRPFLANKKKAMIRYAENNYLTEYVVEDETNQHNQHFRNKIRNVILPMLADKGIEKVVFKKFYSDF